MRTKQRLSALRKRLLMVMHPVALLTAMHPAALLPAMCLRPAALLLLAACLPLLNACRTDDLPGMDDGGDGTPTTPPEELVGKPVCFGGLTVTEVAMDAETRAATPVPYTEYGATMTVKMTVTVNGTPQTHYADYTYHSAKSAKSATAGWQVDATSKALCWQDATTSHSFTAYCPRLTDSEKEADRNTPLSTRTITLPGVFASSNYIQYDYLSKGSATSTPTTAGITFSGMKHLMARVEIAASDNAPTPVNVLLMLNLKVQGSLNGNNNTVSAIAESESSNIQLWKDGETFRAFLLPGQTLAANADILYAIDAQSYVKSGSSQTSAAGSILKITLPTITSTTINNKVAGSLSLPTYSYSKLVKVTGTINAADIATLKAAVADSKISSLDLSEANYTEGTEFPAEFNNCSTLRYIQLPQGVTSIARDGFRNAKNLWNISLPSTLRTIGEYAFTFSGLSNITIPEGMDIIGRCAFEDAANLQSISFPSTLKTIGEYAFKNSGLSAITLPEGLETIETGTFENAVYLQSISLPSTLKTIGEYAFKNSGLSTITLPEGLETIETGTFENAVYLQSISLPSTLRTIGKTAFKNSGLANLALSGESDIALNSEGMPSSLSLFLYGNVNKERAEVWKAWGSLSWSTVYYGYKGTGDRLDATNYNNSLTE